MTGPERMLPREEIPAEPPAEPAFAEAGLREGHRTPPFYRCMMVTTGKEEEVLRLLRVLNLGAGIIPRRVRIRKSRGEWREDQVPLLPGYIFVHEEEEAPLWKYQMLLDVIRVLRYDREPYGYMRDRDLRFAETLFRMEGTVRPLQAVDEGDWVRITDGLLQDLNGTVLSVDRHKRQAKIRVSLMGQTRVIYMNYSLLEKEDLPAYLRSPAEKQEEGEFP